MTQQPKSSSCTVGCICLCAVVGLFAMVLAKLLADLSWPGSIFLGLTAAVIAAVLFLWIFCKPLPALENDVAAPAAPEPKVKPAAAKTAPKAKPAAAKPAKPAPKKAASEAKTVSDEFKPKTMSAARAGGADNLKLIKGVGPKLEALLHRLGFFHFDQVASWTADEVAWVDENLEGFKGRVSRDEWVAQAKILAAGGETEFSKKDKK